MAAEEQFLNLFDCYWFEHNIFTKKPPFSTPEPNPVHEILEKPKLCSIPTLHIRSLSDHCLSSLSPKSVLTPKLQTILSGKEAGDFSEPIISKQEEIDQSSVKKKQSEIKRRRKQGNSKSLSELEFEELKGFMDLGFVFSEEDKVDSSLVSIIPGLQRLGRKREEEEKEELVECGVSRPYLSEAWELWGGDNQRNGNKVGMNPLMEWRIPAAIGDEMEMKDHLRIWAHIVASTVR